MEQTPHTEEHPESETTSLDDGESMEPGEGPQDGRTEAAPLHGVPTDRDDAA
jgi:hypothetical protein